MNEVWNAWVDPEEMEDESRMRWWNDNWDTAVHQFDVGDPTSTAYTASGKVPGHLLNQFAMSEHDGHLRVATTTGGPWRFEEDAESMVTVLARRDGALENVGQVGNMGRGERIFAVRYVGDVAYIVTFRQTDPFYTVDLSDPTAPVVRGELKITGYSGYLHPVGPDRILGIGQEATDEGRTTGTKVTLFDVSDLDAPRDLATWTQGGGHSGVEWDHRAFLAWKDLAVLPFNDWQAEENGAVVLRVGHDSLDEVGRIDHADDPGTEPVPPCPEVDPADISVSTASGVVGHRSCATMDVYGVTVPVMYAADVDPSDFAATCEGLRVALPAPSFRSGGGDAHEAPALTCEDADVVMTREGLRISFANGPLPLCPGCFLVGGPDNVMASWRTLDGADASAIPVAPPAMLVDSPAWRVHFKGDRRYGQPKGVAYFQISQPGEFFAPENAARTSAYARLLKSYLTDYLREDTYAASEAGLQYSCDFTAKGLRLEFAGYSDKLLLLLQKVRACCTPRVQARVTEVSRLPITQRRQTNV